MAPPGSNKSIGALRKADIEQQKADARGKLDHLPATVAANTRIHDAAAILATIGLVRDTAATTNALALVLPFLTILTTEGCTLVFPHIGLRQGISGCRTTGATSEEGALEHGSTLPSARSREQFDHPRTV